MSSGGGGSTSTKLDPAQREILLDSYNFTKGVAGRPWEGYRDSTVAGFSQNQRSAHGLYQNFGLSNMGGEQMQAAQDAAEGAAQYSPVNVSAQDVSAQNIGSQDVTAQNVHAGSFVGNDISAYMNPYTDQVVDRTLSDLDRTRQMQMQGIGDQAAAAGAFGGSRHGVAEAETNRAFADQAASTAASLRDQSFRTGAGLMQSDMDRGMQADLANQRAGLQAGTSNQAAALQAARANQQAGLQAGMSNQAAAMQADLANQQAAAQGQQLNMLGGQQLADLSGEERRRYLERAMALEGIGAQEQALDQARLDDRYARHMAQWNYPIQQAQLLQSAAGGVNLGQTTTQNPGSPNRLAGAAGGAMMGAQMGSVVPGIGTGVGAVVGGIGGAILSDRDSKEQINPADPEQALRGIQQMPVNEWQYKGDTQRHVGPMAQDVQANLGFGNGHSIPLVDAIGSQFAATKALADKVDRLERRKR